MLEFQMLDSALALISKIFNGFFFSFAIDSLAVNIFYWLLFIFCRMSNTNTQVVGGSSQTDKAQ